MPHKHGAFRFVLGVQHGLWQKHPLIKREIKTSKKIRLREETIIAIMIGLLFYDRHWPFLSFFSLFYEGKSSTNAQTWLKKFKSAIAVCRTSSLLNNHPPTPLPCTFSVYGYRRMSGYKKKDTIPTNNFENSLLSDANLHLTPKIGSWLNLTNSNLLWNYVGNIFFEIQIGFKHLKWNKTPRKHGAFGFHSVFNWAFGRNEH